MPASEKKQITNMLQHLSPVLQSPDGAPQHPLAPSAGITVGVEEGNGGAAVSGPPGVPDSLKPEAHCYHQQDEDGDQEQAYKQQRQQQLPQQPEATASY